MSFTSFKQAIPITVVLLPALVALVLYWPVLNLPLIYDTLLHIRITGELNWHTVWLPTPSFGFYRPLTFVPLLLIKDLFGDYPVWLLQGMNWLQHGINTALLGWLVYRLWPDRPWRTLFTGLLFALFPFSYQAVAVYGHNVHPTTTGLLLLGLHLYLRARRGNSGKLTETQGNSDNHNPRPILHTTYHAAHLVRWLPTALVFVLALLSHESALLFGALAALVGWAAGDWPLAAGKETHRTPHTFISSKTKESKLHLLTHFVHYAVRSPWFVFLVLGAGYFILYQFLPISRAPQAAATTSFSLSLRGLYLLQAAAFPFTWFASLLPQNWGVVVVVLSAAATLLFTLFTLRYPAYRLPLFLGWGWWSLAALVIAIPLPTDYLLHGPRLLYLSSVGLAIAWGVLLDRIRDDSRTLVGTQSAGSSKQSAINHSPPTIHHLPFISLQSLVSLLCLAFILATTWQFVRARLGDYTQLTSGVALAAEAMAGEPASSGITLINLPQWLARPRPTYPIGAELEQMLGDYLFAEELMAHNLGMDHPVLAVVMPDLLQTAVYGYGLHEQHSLERLTNLPTEQTQHFFVTRYLEEGPVMIHLGWLQADDAAATPLASFPVYDLLFAEASSCGGTVQVKLIWRGHDPIPPTTSIFVQLLNPSGQLIAQADGPPLSLRPDVMPWRGRMLVDLRTLPLGEGQKPAQILVGGYDYVTGERLTGVDAAAQPLRDNAFTIPITPCP